MQTGNSNTSLDTQIEAAFGRPITALLHDIEPPDVRRVLEIRAMLAVVERHLDQIRDRLHTATAPDRNCAELADEDLTVDAEWLAAASRSRNRHAQAITSLLRAGPPASHPKQVRTATEATARSAPSPPARASTTALPHR
ncbi:hypothetical protein [Streptomyces decoyicus]|uniref:hypothetical protein n=1 Tax=Streptomyces decoyicus TaxID=249567 RepID=UPI00386BC96F